MSIETPRLAANALALLTGPKMVHPQYPFPGSSARARNQTESAGDTGSVVTAVSPPETGIIGSQLALFSDGCVFDTAYWICAVSVDSAAMGEAAAIFNSSLLSPFDSGVSFPPQAPRMSKIDGSTLRVMVIARSVKDGMRRGRDGNK